MTPTPATLLSSIAMRFASHLCSAFLASGTLRSSITRPSFYRSNTQLSMSTNHHQQVFYPELVVFDMDACLWDQEMYEMRAMPSETVMGDLNGRGEGVVGVMSGRDKISLHKGSLIALQEIYDGLYPDTKFCMASSADTPFAEKVGRASLKLLEVVPGVTIWMKTWDNQDVNQIGRQPPLSSNKSKTHFPRIRELTGIRYDKMLFFDDCLWGDHCGMVEANCREEESGVGPATVRTPNGLREQEWRQGLEVFADHANKLASTK